MIEKCKESTFKETWETFIKDNYFCRFNDELETLDLPARVSIITLIETESRYLKLLPTNDVLKLMDIYKVDLTNNFYSQIIKYYKAMSFYNIPIYAVTHPISLVGNVAITCSPISRRTFQTGVKKNPAIPNAKRVGIIYVSELINHSLTNDNEKWLFATYKDISLDILKDFYL